MRSMMWRGTAALLLLLWAGAAWAGPWSLSTLPSDGHVAGAPGETVGWGYEITNDDIENSLLVTGLSADAFQSGTPDAFIFDFPAVAPGATVTIAFDPVGFWGLYAFTWDVDAPAGAVNAGTFVASAEWYDADPFDGGNVLAVAADASAPYSVSLESPPVPVPEPGSVAVFLPALVMLASARRRRN